ncbi:MAG: DUF488 family protein [Smithellaceae bacterium]|jgi:uncharacterized protein YeaO (DUF488 family)
MKTSYFGNPKTKNNPNAVSIARWPPRWWGKRARFISLAPPGDLVKRFKTGSVSWPDYCAEYQSVLDKNDPAEIYELLKGKILLCYEKPGENCHRRLVADWLEKTLKIKIPEL